MGSSDARLVDFAQSRVNQIADAIDRLAGQIRLTNSDAQRLNREVGDLCNVVGSLRAEMRVGFDRVDRELRDTRGEAILEADHIISAATDDTRHDAA